MDDRTRELRHQLLGPTGLETIVGLYLQLHRHYPEWGVSPNDMIASIVERERLLAERCLVAPSASTEPAPAAVQATAS
jgi:hypothetical protein